MADVLKLRLGADVVVTDRNVGVLKRIIFVPETYVVTHLDVAPHLHQDGRLVPIEVVNGTDAMIRLSCTREQFLQFGSNVKETEVPVPPGPAVDDLDLVQQPAAFGFGLMSGFGGPGGLFFTAGLGAREHVESEALPEGAADLERGARVYATDGHVGHAEGLVVSKANFCITHLLLGEGHVFDVREVAIPVESVVESAAQTANLSLSKAEIDALPAIEG